MTVKLVILIEYWTQIKDFFLNPIGHAIKNYNLLSTNFTNFPSEKKIVAKDSLIFGKFQLCVIVVVMPQW